MDREPTLRREAGVQRQRVDSDPSNIGTFEKERAGLRMEARGVKAAILVAIRVAGFVQEPIPAGIHSDAGPVRQWTVSGFPILDVARRNQGVRVVLSVNRPGFAGGCFV